MCVIVRKNEGMDRRLYPTYELSLEDPERPRSVFLLRAAKKKRSRGSYYAITSESAESPNLNLNGSSPGSGGASSNDFQDRKATDTQYGVLGKLRSNFLGTAFNVYSNGRNPFSGGGGGDPSHHRHHDFEEDGNLNDEKDGKPTLVRQEFGAVIYVSLWWYS